MGSRLAGTPIFVETDRKWYPVRPSVRPRCGGDLPAAEIAAVINAATRPDMAPAAAEIAAELRAQLNQRWMRVIDLFREWDEDGSGSISRKEFRAAMAHLGLEAPRAEVDALLDAWDPDRSGSIEIAELYRQLRSGADMRLAAELQPGAAGEIELERSNRRGLRTGGSPDRLARRQVAREVSVGMVRHPVSNESPLFWPLPPLAFPA